MDKWEKVITLHNLLKSSKYPLPLEDILNELECSRATFYRVKDFLRYNLNAPLIYDRNYRGYIYDESHAGSYEIPGLWLTTDELEALSCFEYFLTSIQSNILDDILAPVHHRIEKLLKAQRISKKAWKKRIKIIPLGSRVVNSQILLCIAESVLRLKKVRITYSALHASSETTRSISPQTLLRYRDNWYVDAWCHKRNDLRTFSINRISKAALLNEKAITISQKVLKQHFTEAYGIFSGKAEHIAEIKFTGHAAKAVSQETWHPRQQGEMKEDGSYTLKIPYHESRELIMDIMRWGPMAEVIKPEALRNEIKQLLKNTFEKYK